MNNNNQESGMYNDNNSDFDKKTVKMELFFYAYSPQHDCNSTAIKLELLHNIILFSNANDLNRCKRAVYKVESSSIKYNLFVVQRVESNFTECNTSVFTKLSIVDNRNDIKLCSKTMIKANRHFFNSVNAISEYVKTFDFSENHLMI